MGVPPKQAGSVEDEEAALWCVFDGHLSHEVAGHAAQEVPGLVWDSPHWPSAPGEALRGALRECHESARKEGMKGGSTAVVVAAAQGNLWCAYAGDSRAVVGLRGGGARRLSEEHTADFPGERRRVREAGGCIEGGRIGGLPMTRGLGNFKLESAGFACLPDVQRIPRSEAEFVVIASDGLWDVLDNEVCCEEVRRWQGPGLEAHLVNMARKLGSSDDIAVVVVYFPQDSQSNFFVSPHTSAGVPSGSGGSAKASASQQASEVGAEEVRRLDF